MATSAANIQLKQSLLPFSNYLLLLCLPAVCSKSFFLFFYRREHQTSASIYRQPLQVTNDFFSNTNFSSAFIVLRVSISRGDVMVYQEGAVVGFELKHICYVVIGSL